MKSKQHIGLNTCPDAETAHRIASMLVEQQVAACVNIISGISSVYRWQGEITSDSEFLLIIKSNTDCYAELEQRLRALHPYELPEIVAVPITGGLPDYLDWLNNNTKHA